jgi:hypothetical protein
VIFAECSPKFLCRRLAAIIAEVDQLRCFDHPDNLSDATNLKISALWQELETLRSITAI